MDKGGFNSLEHLKKGDGDCLSKTQDFAKYNYDV